jgi:ribosomal protein L23
MDIYEVVVRPLETEKAYLQRELGQSVFMVNR